MRALSSLFNPFRGVPSAHVEETLLGACQSGNFAAAMATLSTYTPALAVGNQEELNRALATLLLAVHVRGTEWGNTEATRWVLIRRLRAVGASVPRAMALMPGALRRMHASHWNALREWGAPVDASTAWKMWGAWVDDPILSDSPPPAGEDRMIASEALSAVRNMVAHGLRADCVDAEGRTPLHVLCATARLRPSDRLVAFQAWFDLVSSARAPLDACDHDGNNLLHALCEGSSAPLVPKPLLARLIDAYPSLIAARNRFGQLPVDVLRASHRQHRRSGPSEPWLERASWLQGAWEYEGLCRGLPPPTAVSASSTRL